MDGTIDALISAVETYLAVKADYDAKTATIEYDRGYWLAAENRAVLNAKADLAENLNDYIDRRIDILSPMLRDARGD